MTDMSHLGINDVAHFLASIGITTEDAEQWRPCAAAFIEMELKEHPTGSHAPILRQAQEIT